MSLNRRREESSWPLQRRSPLSITVGIGTGPSGAVFSWVIALSGITLWEISS